MLGAADEGAEEIGAALLNNLDAQRFSEVSCIGALTRAGWPGQQNTPARGSHLFHPRAKLCEIDIGNRKGWVVSGLWSKWARSSPRHRRNKLIAYGQHVVIRAGGPLCASHSRREDRWCRRQTRQLHHCVVRNLELLFANVPPDYLLANRSRGLREFNREIHPPNDRFLKSARFVDDPDCRPFAAFDEVIEPQLGTMPALFGIEKKNVVSLVHDDKMRLVTARQCPQCHEVSKTLSSVRLSAAVIAFTGKEGLCAHSRSQEAREFRLAGAGWTIEKN